MKNTVTNKILIVIVLLIWGGILYKYLKPTNTNTSKGEVNQPKEISFFNSSYKEYELEVLERDPFLGKQQRPVMKTAVKKQIERPKKQRRVRWPVIKYLGLIKKENGEKVALLNVSGSFFKLKKSESTPDQHFSVAAIYKDSVFIRSGSEIKKFKK